MFSAWLIRTSRSNATSFTDPGAGSDDPDRLVDHRAGAQRTL